MRTYVVGFLASFVVAVAATPLVRSLAARLRLHDRPEPALRRHGKPIPRVGGVALLVAVLLPLSFFFAFRERVAIAAVLEASGAFPALFAGAAVTCVLGLVDDVRGLSAWTKLAAQVAIAGGMWAFGYRIALVSNPFGATPVDLGWASLPATIIWYVLVMNAMNLIDGMDGLAAGLGLVSTLVLFLMGAVSQNPVLGTMTAVLGGALAGFLLFNFNPARIFLGDSGSLLLGFMLATLSIMARAKGQAAVALFIPVAALGVPFLDVALSVLRRTAQGRPVFQGDRKHIHHLLQERGLTPRKAALSLYGLAAAFGAIALVSAFGTEPVSNVVLLAIVSALVVIVVRFLGYHRMVWLTGSGAAGLDDPGTRRLRRMLVELARLPPERGWDEFADVLRRHGVLGAHLFRRDGQRCVTIREADAFPREGRDDPRVGATFAVHLPDGTGAELLLEWRAGPGRFAALPHEEALLRVAADLVETLRIEPAQGGGGGQGA